MRQQVTAHSHEVVGGEGDFCEPIVESPILGLSGRLFQEHPLVRGGHEITRAQDLYSADNWWLVREPRNRIGGISRRR